MSNIMMGIVAEMLAAHGAKVPAEEAPVEGGEGTLDALEAEAEETFAAVLAEDPVARTKAPEDAPMPKNVVEEGSEPQVKGLSEQAPVRLDNRSVHTTPRIPFEAAELPKTPVPKGAVERDPTEIDFETVSPENANPVAKGEDGLRRAQTTSRSSTDLPTSDTAPPVATSFVTPDATPLVAAVEAPVHSTETSAVGTVPTQEQPVVANTPAPPRAEDPIAAEARPRDLPPVRPEKTAPFAQSIQVNDGSDRVNIPAEAPKDRPVTGETLSAEVPDFEMRGVEASQIVISDPVTATAQNALPQATAKPNQTQPEASDSDPIPAKAPETDEPDLGARVVPPQPTTPPAPTPRPEIVTVAPETGPPQPKLIIEEPPKTPELSDDPQIGSDTTPSAAVTADGAPNPPTFTSPPPSTAQTPTPQVAAPTAIDLPQVDGSAPTPSTTPTATTERDVPPVAQQVAIAVSKSDGGTIELALRPVELGETQISMEFEAERLLVTVAAERPETQDLMRRQIDDLAREFRDLGYRDVSFRFEQQAGQQGQSRQAQGDAQSTNHGEIEPDLSPETPAPRPTYVSGRLDIRL